MLRKAYYCTIFTYINKFYVYLNYSFLNHFICIFSFSVHSKKSQFIIRYFSNHKMHLKYAKNFPKTNGALCGSGCTVFSFPFNSDPFGDFCLFLVLFKLQ